MKRLKIALGIAIVGVLISIVGILIGIYKYNNTSDMNMQDFALAFNVITIGWLVSMVAYLFGGLGTAIKLAGKIAKWGWVVMPFPIDLITFPFAFLIALFILLFAPIIPIAIAYKESL